MAWSTPKTDWSISYDENGTYTGDYFNIGDYNRIKGNIEYIHTLANIMYEDFKIAAMAEKSGTDDYPYAEEINTLENNLVVLCEKTDFFSTTAKTYYSNQPYLDHIELNRIESLIYELYKKLHSQAEGRRMFTFMFGAKEVF